MAIVLKEQMDNRGNTGRQERMIITAASAAFGPSLLALLGSLNLNWPDHPPVRVYDIGLDEATVAELNRNGVELVPVPPFCSHWRKHFTWKIWCWNDAPALEILWMDAGVVVLQPLGEAFDAIGRLGYFTVPTFHLLTENASVQACRGCGVDPSFRKGKLTLAGTVIGFKKEGLMDDLLKEAFSIALVEENIASSESTHRHDQMIISLLLYKYLGQVVMSDGIVYCGWLSPRQVPGQKIWVHRRDLLKRDQAYLASRISSPGPPFAPRDPVADRPVRTLWKKIFGPSERFIRRTIRGDRDKVEIYDGVRDGYESKEKKFREKKSMEDKLEAAAPVGGRRNLTTGADGRMSEIGKYRSDERAGEGFPFSIGITTFQHRFDPYFVPLLNRIREYNQDVEIIVAVNGEHKVEFNEEYRSRILTFIAQQPNVFPILFPNFRGLSKLWNTIIIHSSHDRILMLNDDIMIEDSRFFRELASAIAKSEKQSFVINRSWSHFVISRTEIDELGYFDERLLGIGEEDGDMIWRYLKAYGRPLKSFSLPWISNYADKTEDYRPINIHSRPGMKYSQFNRDFMFNEKYEKDPAGLKGMFDEPVSLKDAGKNQYPYEKFFRRRREEL